MYRSVVILLVVVTFPLLSTAQDEIFSDGFEAGDACQWSFLSRPQVCHQIAVPLPGNADLTMAFIPPGTFQMGSPIDEQSRFPDEDLHEVTLTRGFFLGTHEITQAQWGIITGAPMSASCGSYGIGPDYPVYCVTWHEVAGPGGFIERINNRFGTDRFRLTTEAEAERAIRGETQTRFSHGDILGPPCDDYCAMCAEHDESMVWCGNNNLSAEPVGSRSANAYGLYDIHGNVLEWVQDWYTYVLGTGPQIDPTGPETGSSSRVLRGGHWDEDARNCRSASRGWLAPGGASRYTGFRLAMTR